MATLVPLPLSPSRLLRSILPLLLCQSRARSPALCLLFFCTLLSISLSFTPPHHVTLSCSCHGDHPHFQGMQSCLSPALPIHSVATLLHQHRPVLSSLPQAGVCLLLVWIRDLSLVRKVIPLVALIQMSNTDTPPLSPRRSLQQSLNNVRNEIFNCCSAPPTHTLRYIYTAVCVSTVCTSGASVATLTGLPATTPSAPHTHTQRQRTVCAVIRVDR